jgi:hypothetical protein
MDAANKSDITVYIDESGSITKKDIEHHKYFIIAVLFTRNSQLIKRHYRKGITSLLQDNKYRKLLKNNGEIKGVDISETKKYNIYDRIIRNCSNDFEIGVIVLDNNYTTDNFIKNHARTFNYILQVFFDSLFRNSSKYANTLKDVHMIIDEQNIATDAAYTLDEYLNQQLNIINPICNHFDVTYVDSKYYSLIQLIDFISNTFYRNLEKHDDTSIQNIRLLEKNLCGGRIFDFSKNHDTKLYFGKNVCDKVSLDKTSENRGKSVDK